MNIFKTTGDILGTHDKKTADSSLSSFYGFARQIRMQLGKRGYLLDNYLSLFFEAVNDNLAVNASEKGFESAETYQALCVQVLNNSYDLQDSPLSGICYTEKFSLCIGRRHVRCRRSDTIRNRAKRIHINHIGYYPIE